jgi:hypothetical protein
MYSATLGIQRCPILSLKQIYKNKEINLEIKNNKKIILRNCDRKFWT